jgi:tetratricopeptide (TPR) repeat protein
MDIAEPTIKSSPILGAGPDRFVNQYLQYKPEIVNATPFWSSDFSNGAGFVLTTLVTEGILGFVLWIALIVAFIWFGARNLLSKQGADQSPFVRYGTAASYFGGGLLWLSLISYMPQHAILLVLFVLTGIFAAHIVSAPGKAVHFIAAPKKVPAIILLWLLIAVSAIAIIYFAKAAVAEAYFQVAIQDLNNGGSLSVSAQKIQSALKFNKSDVYYQAIAQMDVYAVNEIVSNATTTPSEDTIDLIGGLVNDGINSAKLAQNFDPTNPYNYISEAQVAVVAAGIGIQGAYADATSTYAKALTLDPFDPSIYLDAAQLEFFEKNTSVAEADLNTALELKPDYTDALFEAGVISYETGDYATAVKAFTQVQQIDSTYTNIQQAIDVAKAAESGNGTSSVTPSAPPVTTAPASTATTTPIVTGKKAAASK